MAFRDGAVVNVGVKSGTNSIHGTAYAFGRDAAATDSANYFQRNRSPRQPWSSSARRRADPSSRTSSSGLQATRGCGWRWRDLTNDTIPADVAMGNPNFSMVDACNALNPGHLPLGAAGNQINPLSAQISGLNPRPAW